MRQESGQNECHTGRTDILSQVMMRRLLIFLMVAALACGCRGGSNSGRAVASADEGLHSFPYPEPPAMMSGAGAVKEWMAVHFWDKYIKAADGLPDNENLRNEAMSNYVLLLNEVSPTVVRAAQESAFSQAEAAEAANPEGQMLHRLLRTMQHYLADPNSPYRNQDYYIPILEKAIASSVCSDEEKTGAAYLLSVFSLNQTGEVAADFRYSLRNGRTGHLYGISSEWIIIMFSNPGCEDCRATMEALQADASLTKLLADGRLTILNVYPDSDLSLWFEYAAQYPKEWINGFDPDGVLKSDTVYYLPAIPSLYLLDGEKRVVCKDAPTERILARLKKIE